jgi:hypothetical protein
MERKRLASLWRRTRWPLFIAGFLTASVYAVGGPRLFRFRARAAALLEPPTDAEMQRAVDTLAQSIAPARIPGNEPAPLSLMLVATGLVILATCLLVFASTRWKR